MATKVYISPENYMTCQFIKNLTRFGLIQTAASVLAVSSADIREIENFVTDNDEGSDRRVIKEAIKEARRLRKERSISE